MVAVSCHQAEYKAQTLSTLSCMWGGKPIVHKVIASLVLRITTTQGRTLLTIAQKFQNQTESPSGPPGWGCCSKPLCEATQPVGTKTGTCCTLDPNLTPRFDGFGFVWESRQQNLLARQPRLEVPIVSTSLLINEWPDRCLQEWQSQNPLMLAWVLVSYCKRSDPILSSRSRIIWHVVRLHSIWKCQGLPVIHRSIE